MVECLTGKKVLMKGNYAIANAAVLAGCQCYFGYPITPQSEIGEFMSGKMQELNRAYVSAESEGLIFPLYRNLLMLKLGCRLDLCSYITP